VKRVYAVALVAIMLMVVVGQAWLLRGQVPVPVEQVQLHESRLLAFMQEIRQSNPVVYDSLHLNLRRLRDAQAQGADVQVEEALVAEQLLARLTGQPSPSKVP
jgi:hypothetical protein